MLRTAYCILCTYVEYLSKLRGCSVVRTYYSSYLVIFDSNDHHLAVREVFSKYNFFYYLFITLTLLIVVDDVIIITAYVFNMICSEPHAV